MIDVQTLIACGIHPTQAAAFAVPIAAACDAGGMTTSQRQAAFIAQCAHESAGFTALVENLFYTNPQHIHDTFGARAGDLEACAKLARNPQALANRVYANRCGNGDEASGDGWRFRGSGLIQLTFRDNHTRCAAALGRDLDGFGDWLRTPDGAVESAAWFWLENHLNALADAGDLMAMTKVINGGTNGLQDRIESYRIALAAISGAARTAQA